ncbi:MAG: response regulator receiver [Tardiphaga sp.]|nr:response regulator receiver [Tardiphaga sp.]
MARREIVLIVEDEPLLRMLAAESIEADGYEAVEAGHADDAILILESRPDIKIVFTDINMPGSMDGLKLAHYVRDRWPPVRIITTSGRAQLTETMLPLNSQFLPKPYQASDLTAALHRLA